VLLWREHIDGSSGSVRLLLRRETRRVEIVLVALEKAYLRIVEYVVRVESHRQGAAEIFRVVDDNHGREEMNIEALCLFHAFRDQGLWIPQCVRFIATDALEFIVLAASCSRVPSDIALAKIQSLRVAVRLETCQSLFISNTRLLMATKWDLWVHFKVGVDPNSSCLNFLRNLFCSVNIFRPNRSSKSIERVVGFGNGFFVICEA
jgi:hypothetical protein